MVDPMGGTTGDPRLTIIKDLHKDRAADILRGQGMLMKFVICQFLCLSVLWF